MKKIYLFLALCISAVVCSCSDDDNPVSGKTEFIMMGGYEGADGLTEDAQNEQSAIILKAFQNVGFSDKYELILAAEDSAAVSKIIADKMQLVVKELEASPAKIKATIIVKGVEKKYLGAENDKEHPVNLFYQKTIGLVQGDIWWRYIQDDFCDGRWVYDISTEVSSWLPESSTPTVYNVAIGQDTNWGVGGDYVYVRFDFTGAREINENNATGLDYDYWKKVNHYVWENAYADKYITDVICIYGGGEPQQITIDGRRYQKANRVADLNKHAGGEYVYLYTTTDPVKGYEGYYLNTGTFNSGHKCCRMLYSKSHFWAKDHMNAPFVFEGHRFVERVVQAYWTNGTYAEEMNTNKGHGEEYTRCRMILTYATKNGGY